MPLPIAHSLIGASIVAAAYSEKAPREYWKKLVIGAALATAPDLDYLPMWLLDLSPDWHRGLTHSLLFGISVGLLVYVLRGRRVIREPLAYGLAVISHGLLDTLVSIKGGVALLWPLPHRLTFGLFEYPDTLAWTYYSFADALVIKGIYALLKWSWYELFFCGTIFLLILCVNRILRDRRTALRKPSGRKPSGK